MEMNKSKSDELEIDLGQIFSVLLSKIVIILLSGLIFGLAAFLVSKLFIKPVYESTTSLYVLNRQIQGTTTYNDLQSSTQLTQDYKILVRSRNVTEKVISELNLDMTSDELADMITVSSPSNTRVLEIAVSAKDPYKAKEIADKVADISAESICDIMQIEKVNIIEQANIPDQPVSHSYRKNALLAAVLGLILATAIVIIRFLTNDTIHTTEDVERYLGLSTLALIPLSEDLDDSNGKNKKSGKKDKSARKGVK